MKELKQKIVVLGADHNGVALKNSIKKLLGDLGYFPVDIGPHDNNKKVDYTDYAHTIGQIITNKEAGWGILICGTGVGMSMAVNRFPSVRASLVHSVEVAKKTREHNDANVLCLGSWVNPEKDNLNIVRAWLGEKFGEGRHIKRVAKLGSQNKEKIVFTNGVFDLLHKGHIELLKFAKSLGGKLIVAINSDRAAKILKGPGRPINSEVERKAVLESLGFVDQVIVFDDIKTQKIVKKIMPDILLKGAEWTAGQVRKRDKVPQNIDVVVFPLVMGPSGTKYSTSNLVKKMSRGA